MLKYFFRMYTSNTPPKCKKLEYLGGMQKIK